MNTPTPKQEKPILGILISWFCIIFGASAIATPAVYAAFGMQSGQFLSIYYLTLGIVSLALGYFGLKSKPAAFFLIVLIFLPQIIAFTTPESNYNFIGPIQIGYGFGNAQQFYLHINLLAILVCSLSAATVFKLTKQTGKSTSNAA
ncbi:hypothetical protein IB229_02505 [Pseudomonas sp. PDM14]|uniref:hypothetical protein n=1 Tax=Pseudomonas sp. PDM14 TaxID=2769288 RepID=UPI00178429C8|nr:hypothetical protein [Pseudomonas sp. PDM14]MBD9481827.1 hypothetical protein [Pseudomonas sp. PDM14]